PPPRFGTRLAPVVERFLHIDLRDRHIDFLLCPFGFGERAETPVADVRPVDRGREPAFDTAPLPEAQLDQIARGHGRPLSGGLTLHARSTHRRNQSASGSCASFACFCVRSYCLLG